MKSPCRSCKKPRYKACCFDSCKAMREFRAWMDQQPDCVPASDASQEYRLLPM